MQNANHLARLIELDVHEPIWEHFFWVAPLVLIGTREMDGTHDKEAQVQARQNQPGPG